MMRVAVAVVVSYFAVAFAVPVPPDLSPLETVQRGDMPVERALQEQISNPEPRGIHFVHPALQNPQAEPTSRLSAGTQAQLSSQAQSWAPQFPQHLPVSAYQPSPNIGLPVFPAQTQYQPVYQMPQLVYFPMLGAQDRNAMLAYAMPAFYPTTSAHSPANSGPSMPSVPRRPAPKVQTQSPTLSEHGQGPRQQLQQPYQQQTPQIVYVVQQPMRQPFGGISSEEIQAQGRLGRLSHLGRLGRPQLVPQLAPQLVPQLGTSLPPGSPGPFVPLRQPPIQPLNPAFPAIPSVSNPVLFPSVPKATPNIPSIHLPNPAAPNVGRPAEETLSSFGASPDVPEAAISAERMRPSTSSPSHSPDVSEKTIPTNPNIVAPTVMTDTAPEPTASITDVYS